MQSMTGYGRARACRDGREITIELKTVNHRFLDLSFRMPKNLMFLEDMLRARINASALKRGHVDVFVTYANTRADAREVSVDGTLLEAFAQALKGAKDALDPYRRMTAAEALTLSGALTITQAEEDAGAVGELAAEAFDAALDKLMDMRLKEGDHLRADLRSNLEELSALRQAIAARAPEVPARIPPASHGQTGRMAGERPMRSAWRRRWPLWPIIARSTRSSAAWKATSLSSATAWKTAWRWAASWIS